MAGILLPAPILADLVTLRNGKQLDGKVMGQSRYMIIILYGGRRRRVRKSSIRRIRYGTTAAEKRREAIRKTKLRDLKRRAREFKGNKEILVLLQKLREERNRLIAERKRLAELLGRVRAALPVGRFTRSYGVTTGPGNAFPFWDRDTLYQDLFLNSEINGSGNIVAVQFVRGTAETSSSTCADVTLKLGHTSLTALTNTFTNNVQEGRGSLSTVLNKASVTFPAGPIGDWVSIPLSPPFHYNGVDSLVVQVEVATACTTPLFRTATQSVTNRRIATGTADATPGIFEITATTAVPDTQHASMKFVFAGGIDQLDMGGVFSTPYPFNATSTPKQQTIYTAANIDGSGPITAIGFQMNATSITGNYTYSVRMGHTSLSSFTAGDSFSATYNVDGFKDVAVNRSFIIPAGIPSGEWFWLPIPDGYFVYNGTDNLAVEVSVPAADITNNLRYSTASSNLRHSSTDANGTISEAANTYATHTQFRFSGSTMDVAPAPTGNSMQVFSVSGGEIQSLYLATELGTSCTITSIRLRLNAAGTGTTHPGVTIRMGHTVKTGFLGRAYKKLVLISS